MGDRTGISWTDATWNPVTGCDKVSPGCDHCYAESVAHRFAGTKAYPNGFDVTLWPERLGVPLRWTRPRHIFVNSMSDLFHARVPVEFIAAVLAVSACAPRHTFQILTKRHARMRSVMTDPRLRELMLAACDPASPYYAPGLDADAVAAAPWPLPNVWVGVSAEDQKRADLRIPVLLDVPAARRFVSAEPLLGPLRLDPAWTGGLDWVIVGGESGPNARPMDPDWVRGVRDDAVRAGVAFFFKQWGGVRAKDNGNTLDDAVWEQMPQR